MCGRDLCTENVENLLVNKRLGVAYKDYLFGEGSDSDGLLVCTGWGWGNLWHMREGETRNLAWIRKKSDQVFLVVSLPCWTAAMRIWQSYVAKKPIIPISLVIGDIDPFSN